MHDIHPATAMALPTLLKELKSQGYHVVQVVPAGERPAVLPELVASPAEDKGNWPRLLKTSASTSSDETPSRHRIKKAHASGRAALQHRIKKAHSRKRRPGAVASVPASDDAASHGWQLGQF